jgi:hypothetical protein
MRELARKIDRLEKNFAKADYILSEVMSALMLNPEMVDQKSFEWAMRNYTKYIKDKEGG